MVTPEFANAYKKFVAENQAKNLRISDEVKRESHVKELFELGEKIATTYRDRIVPLNFVWEQNPPKSTWVTHPVTLTIGEKTSDFVLKATGWTERSKPLSQPLFHSISVVPNEDEPTPLFSITEKSNHKLLTTPLNGKNSPEEIEIARNILNIFQQSLSEKHAPLSHETSPKPKPESKPKRGFLGLLNPKRA